ncbi:MAG: DUF2634 domain-containing protein [Oscillospiraceae bacterium]|jgi:hypothetical protein|nr:DUF2634 domain-containing protein [Oscillospiraceae bacterium]
MIPQSFIPKVERKRQPDISWRLEEDTIAYDKITGLEAVRQTVFLILSVERYEYVIYSWNYGTELWDLFGQPVSFVRPEFERRVRDALSQDDRITAVDGFAFEWDRKRLHCRFTVRSVFGDFETSCSVEERDKGETHVRAYHL